MIETSNILNKLLLKNDKHIINSIMEYAYPMCCDCKTLFNDEFRLRYDDKVICMVCFIMLDYKKCLCKKYFILEDGNFCYFCLERCRVFCPDCLSNIHIHIT